MSIHNELRTSLPRHGRQLPSRAAIRRAAPLVVAFMLMGCGGATRRATVPHGKTTTTSASIAAPSHVERLVVAERGNISMVSRGGCVATVRTSDSGGDELRVRCPKPERLVAWFDGADRVLAGFAYEAVKDDDDEEVALPAAKVLTNGKTFKIAQKADVEKLAKEVSALSAELALSERPAPGPDSPSGWQMLHVSGPARVLFAGNPAKGAFDARVSTNGQYLCEFVTNVGDGQMRATKSGWLEPATATKAIDEVLAPFAALGPSESSKSTYAAGMKSGAETRSNASSTAAVLERFTQMQEALGDACLPEIEVEPAQIGL